MLCNWYVWGDPVIEGLEIAARCDFYSAADPYRRLVGINLTSPVNTGAGADGDTSFRPHHNMGIFKHLHAIAKLHWSTTRFLVNKHAIIDEYMHPPFDCGTMYPSAGGNKPPWGHPCQSSPFEEWRHSYQSKASYDSTNTWKAGQSHPQTRPIPS
ncbi:hypothetical protein COMA2_160055 [Candidatus Nitrospira nitrificans]|uniref:Uncharacterized protein n=1 Tax=Candidatus Nitrospira nitrificans TaxID=1742973 RepID=A0A0S4LCH4_9BACT|nr:hypothetical protein COMA2_160055 [Candidatus Nitrospira nitrificans]